MDRTNGDNLDISSGVRKFTDGPPGTTVDAEWLNGIQEELIGVLVAAGVVPNAADNTQLLAAITNLGIGFSQLANTIVDQGGGDPLKTQIIEIGNWDMVASNAVNVPHGITDFTKIRPPISALIRRDDGSFNNPLNSADAAGNAYGGVGGINPINITLTRITGGVFDHINYDSTPFNRGWVFFTHV